MEASDMVGKLITAVHIADDKKALKFEVVGEGPIIVRTDGDCCSETWIENVEAPEFLVGSPILEIVALSMPGSSDDGEDNDGDTIQYYGLRITTAKGSCTIDYRNSSNGYYGGGLSWPGEYFYGGVHGQNISKERWKRIA